MELVRQAIAMDETSRTQLEGEMKRLTGLENPNSILQLHDWLLSQGIETSEHCKKTGSLGPRRGSGDCGTGKGPDGDGL